MNARQAKHQAQAVKASHQRTVAGLLGMLCQRLNQVLALLPILPTPRPPAHAGNCRLPALRLRPCLTKRQCQPLQ